MAGCENRYKPIVIFCAALASSVALGQVSRNGDWPNYGNDPGGMRFSRLTQINRDNVSKLKLAWVFHAEDMSYGSDGRKRSGFETTPIFVDGTLFITTAFNRVIALDPVEGKQLWAYDPHIDPTWEYGDGLVNRGVATWLDPSRSKAQPCRRRIFESTLDARLIALDAATGKPCAGFGENGQASLRNVPGYLPGRYHMTSPPAVIDDIVVVGSAIDDAGGRSARLRRSYRRAALELGPHSEQCARYRGHRVAERRLAEHLAHRRCQCLVRYHRGRRS
jgi:quinoprotein glucose dehydrogenase